MKNSYARWRLGRAVRARKQWNRMKNLNRNFYSRNYNVPSLSTKPQRMGIGTGTLFVTREESTGGSQTPFTISIQDVLNDSQELVLKKNEFMYFKILFVKFIVYPRNTTGGTSASYILLNWCNDHDYSYEQIQHSDSSKTVPVFLISPKVFTYYPPHILVNAGSPRNMDEYATTAVISNYPGWFKIASTSIFDCRIEIKIRFRGAQEFAPNALIKDLNRFISKHNIVDLNTKRQKKKLEKKSKIVEVKEDPKEEVKEVQNKEVDWKHISESEEES